jgi:RHS repeat-associated protein
LIGILDARNLVRLAVRLVLAGLLLCCAPLADGGQFAANLNGHADGDVDLADAVRFQQVFTGPRGGGPGPVPANPYLFTGRRLDFDLRDEDGSLAGQPGRPLLVLYDYRAREYDPWHGRFCQRDPAEYADSLNLYEYVRSNPLVSTDPSGRQLVDVLMATLGQSELRGQEAYRAGVAGALILSMLGAYITYNEFGQMQWGVMGGMSASGVELFLEGLDVTISGMPGLGESMMATAETIAVFMASSQRDALDKIASLWNKALYPHLLKLASGDPNHPGRNNLLRQINDFINQIEHQVMKSLKGKTQEAFRAAIEELRNWVNGGGLGPPPLLPG